MAINRFFSATYIDNLCWKLTILSLVKAKGNAQKKNVIFFVFSWFYLGSRPIFAAVTPQGTTSESSSAGRAQPCQGWGREFESRLSLSFFLLYLRAQVVELVDTQDLKSCGQ